VLPGEILAPRLPIGSGSSPCRPMPLRGLIFDFDGLIVDTETATLAAWRQVHAEDGRHADPRVLHSVVGHVDVVTDLWPAYPPEYDRAALAARFLTLTRERCRQAPVLPGVVDLLDAARAAGLRLAVASNSSHRHVDAHLAARGLLARFATVVCREDVPRGKPAPDLYLEALSRLDLAPAEAVAFEDSMPGHEAAAAAGLRVVVVPNPSTVGDRFPCATLRVGSLSEIDLERLRELPARVAAAA
jgi:putative hydrolase of the HAD superfamily